VKQYEKLFEMDNISLTFTDGALDLIVEKAIDYKLGARGLRSLCEEILNDAMFDFPSGTEDKLNITKTYVEGKLSKSRLNQLKAVS
jgi:ATP-dependent Clp protease ATP-binding subunit ClpX